MKLRAFKLEWRQLAPKLNPHKMTAEDRVQVQQLFNQPESMIAELSNHIQKDASPLPTRHRPWHAWRC